MFYITGGPLNGYEVVFNINDDVHFVYFENMWSAIHFANAARNV